VRQSACLLPPSEACRRAGAPEPSSVRSLSRLRAPGGRPCLEFPAGVEATAQPLPGATASFLGFALLVLLFLLSSLCSPVRGDPLPDPGLLSGDLCVYRAVLLDSGETGYQTLEVRPREEEGRALYEFEMRMDWPDQETTVARSVLEGRGSLRSLSTERQDRSRTGEALLQEEYRFQGAGLFPEDTYSNFAVYFALRGMVAGKLSSGSIFMAIPSGAVSRLKLHCSDPQWVSVPAGRFRCTQVTARTDLSYFMGSLGGFLNYIGYSFIPKSVLWFMDEPPYLLVKYKGLTLVSPRNEPVELELVRWNPSQIRYARTAETR
jgi:hypothetical protein